jgi:hypothetical protein
MWGQQNIVNELYVWAFKSMQDKVINGRKENGKSKTGQRGTGGNMFGIHVAQLAWM